MGGREGRGEGGRGEGREGGERGGIVSHDVQPCTKTAHY